MRLRSWFKLAVVLPFLVCAPPISAHAAGTGSIVYTTTVKGVASFDAMTGRRLGLLPVQNAYGVVLDAARNLYVGIFNPFVTNFAINVYTPGGTQPSRIMETEEFSATIALSRTGELAAAGTGAGSGGLNGLEFFKPGATKASRIITSPTFSAFAYVAYDAAGRCWIDATDQSGRPRFGYVAPGATQITIVPFSGTPAAGALTVDAAGNIVVAEFGVLHAFTSSGQPAYTVNLQGRPNTISGIALSRDNKRLYVANRDTQSEAFRYPSGGRPAFIFGWYSSGISVEN